MKINKKKSSVISWVIFWFYVLVALYLDIEKAGSGETIKSSVKIENLSGFYLFFAQLYNSDKLLFALASLVSMCLIGIILAFLTDRILKLFGFEVSKIKHLE